ncbi:MAG: DNA recombination protein RmuC [Ferruginibacter sp.]|nr:DNA recombination protein RmuC [Ferruginibacter sp.]
MDMNVLLFAAGLVIGLLIAFAIVAATRQQLISVKERLVQQQQVIELLEQDKLQQQKQKEDLMSRATQAEGANKFLQQESEYYHQLQQQHLAIQKQFAILQTQLETAHEKLSSQKQELESIGEKFRFEFRNLAQSILDEKTAKFTQVNEEKMKAILDPLKTELIDFKKKVDDTYDKESKERFTLGKEVQRLIEMSQLVSQEANNLTTALKGNNKQQGNWGEMILESILTWSGLTKGREYLAQEFIRDNAGNIIKDENGKGLQPDITVIYPDQRKVIIDSKVSLVAWEQYVSEDNTAAQRQFLKDHVQSIRNHIDGLSRKNYPLYAQALDYVLLFIPVEPALLEAVKTDLQLWKYAYDKRIMLVSATNLLAVLKIIADLWRVEQQNRHAIEIADKAGALYDKFVGFIENFELVGKKLQDARQSYDTAFSQLGTGRGNMIGKIEELKKMGANANKQLAAKILPPLTNEE